MTNGEKMIWSAAFVAAFTKNLGEAIDETSLAMLKIKPVPSIIDIIVPSAKAASGLIGSLNSHEDEICKRLSTENTDDPAAIKAIGDLCEMMED